MKFHHNKKERAAVIRRAEHRIEAFHQAYAKLVEKYQCYVTAFGWEGELGMGVRSVSSRLALSDALRAARVRHINRDFGPRSTWHVFAHLDVRLLEEQDDGVGTSLSRA